MYMHTVLVVSEKVSVGVGREGGLSCSGETEEEGALAVLAFVGAGVQAEETTLGHLWWGLDGLC